MAESDRIMFEIYREAGYGRKCRVVYFTELDDHNKETEITRAMAGEHVYDGFIKTYEADRAKGVIADILDRLNGGEAVSESEGDELLASYSAAG